MSHKKHAQYIEHLQDLGYAVDDYSVPMYSGVNQGVYCQIFLAWAKVRAIIIIIRTDCELCLVESMYRIGLVWKVEIK